MPIALPKDTQAFLVGSLKRYAREELDLELGDLQAKLFLAYVLTEIGPSVYNQAIADAQASLQEKVADLTLDRYEAEFTFWKKG
ncbi:MAG: DUF2164 domain-containing protein [Holophagaceae bacterium]